MVMDNSKFQSDVLPTLFDCKKLLDRASDLIKGENAVILVETEGMFPDLLYAFHKLVRKLPPGNGIDLILHSLGGTTDTASSIANICKERFGSFRVVVPFLAKSAATLLALTADDRLLPCSAQFGPVDPQVRHPENGMWFPAHSIKEAFERVEATKDPIVKMAMADKLDPLLIGAFEDAISATKQYIEEVVENWAVPDKDTVVNTFVDKFKSHGYPIGRSMLRAINAPYTPIDGETEEYFFRVGDFKDSGKFSALHTHTVTSPITSMVTPPAQASSTPS
jgi:hypothetical protein